MNATAPHLGRGPRALRAVFDFAPGPHEFRSAAGAWAGLTLLFGFCLLATWATLFGSPGDPASATVEAYFRTGALPDGTPWIREHFAVLYLPLLTLAVLVRFGVTFFGTLFYERVCGEPLPLRYVVVMIWTNTLLFALPALVLAGLGLLALSFGLGYEVGTQWLASVGNSVYGAIDRWVPTLVTVPYPFPLLFAMIPGGLGYYWWHRLQHVWRPLWLLSHRTHHTMTHLAQPVSLPASNPLAFFVNAVPQALLIGGASKLFASEPMLLEAMIWVVLSHTLTEVFNHTETVYAWTIGGPLRRFWFHFFGCGAWHQVHHSSEEAHRLVNIGGGPFMLWDRVFGTCVDPPLPKPAMGLTGRPALHWTPMRLALSGHAELIEDLVRNPSWRDRVRILLGPSSYEPPIQSHHLVRDE
jgi:sterol desaturase/sphingolipid hydroxylase (fatty acid hydroxylase superfamily)